MKHGSQQDFQQIPIKGIVPESSATAPSSPVAGQIWLDTSVTPNKVRWYTGSAWTAADGTSIPVGYVTDSMIASGAAIALSKLATDPLARANHTGTQLAATISNFDTQVRTSRLDQMTLPTANVDLNGQRLLNVATPTAGSDGVNKTYVDNSRAGISVKDPVRVVAPANVTLSAPGATIDGVTMATADRFLAANQTTGTENGIYVWNGASSAATRAYDDTSTSQVVDGTLVAVAAGTQANRQFIQTGTGGGAPGTWTQTWVVFNLGGQTYTAGTGLSLSGTQFALNAPVLVSNGGTNATTAAAARTNLGAVGRYAANLGALTAGASTTINHALGSTDVGVWFRTTADGQVLDLTWAVVDANNVTCTPDLAYASGAVRAVVVG